MPVALAISLARLSACTATCWSVSVASHCGSMTGFVARSVELIVTVPWDVVALTATSMDAYCALSVTGEVMAADGTYSTSGQSAEKVASSVRVFSLKPFLLLFGIFSQPV